MNRFRKYYIMLMLFLLGARLLDNKAMLSPIAGRISYGDILFFIYLATSVIIYFMKSPKFKVVRLRRQQMFFLCLFAFSLWTGMSWCVNSLFRSGNILDFFGIPVRVAYYGIMSLFVVRWVREYGSNVLVMPFCIGILAMFYNNFLNAAMRVGEIPIAINEKNFSGVLLPVCAVYFALSILCKPNLSSFVLFLLSIVSTLFVYSLGGFVLIALFLPAIWIMVRRYFGAATIKIHKKVLMVLLLLLLFVIVMTSARPILNTIMHNIDNKIHNLPGISQKTESAHMRFGHFLSSMAISAENPLFGVGEANWQEENNKNRDWLGDWFVENDNPHNGLAQILSMFGIPAFILFAAMFYFVFKELYSLHILKGLEWKIFVASIFMVFVGIANLMSAIFTYYFFYFFASLIFGIKARRQPIKIE